MVTRMKASGTEFPGMLAPIGSILGYAGTTEPTGWVFCDGAALSRTDYAALFAALGTSFGTGDGSTTFNVPDLRGRVPVGKDDMGSGAASRVVSGSDGLDGATFAAVGAKLVETDATKSHASVIHYIIRATTTDA
jgi:microcystin-dependent protein